MTMETKFRDFLEDQMNDAEFRREYEALEDEDALLQSLVDSSEALYLTQIA